LAFRRGAFPERRSDEIQVLLVIAAAGEARVPEVAEQLAVDRSTARHAITRLMRDGLLSERPDPDDGRRSFFGTTASGRRLLRRYVATLGDDLLEELARRPR
jgi:DNA-binding MarR family transcriptional regulator